MANRTPSSAQPLVSDSALLVPRRLPRVSRRGLLAVPLLAGLAWPGLARAAPSEAAAAPRGPLALDAPAPPGLPRVATAQTDLSPAVAARLPAAMREAIAQARLARYAFGAVLLDAGTGQTVYRAHNISENGDPTAHGEVTAMRGAGMAGIDLTRTVLVTTAEPCPMCAAASVWAQVAGIVFGTSIAALIRFGWSQLDLASGVVVGYSPFGVPPVVGSVLVEETDPLYAAGPPAFPPPKG
jgi:tRNA(adenine34) deaminase